MSVNVCANCQNPLQGFINEGYCLECKSQSQSNDKFTVNKITDGVSIALDQFTCTATERAFLDEIREKIDFGTIWVAGEEEPFTLLGIPNQEDDERQTSIYQFDFKTNLEELFNEWKRS